MSILSSKASKRPNRLPAIASTSSALIDDVLALAQQADALLLDYYSNAGGLGVENKEDLSPVTIADRKVHELLVRGLSALTPSIPVLSEESPDSVMSARREWCRYWIVDPLDGTKEFLARTGEFTVNIALIVDARPVMGVLSVPTRETCYLGIPGTGAWCFGPADASGRRSEAQVIVHPLDRKQPLRVLASQRHNPERVAALLAKLDGVCNGTTRVDLGSALKFSALLSGEGDIYPRTSPCYEWDVAAGDALVTAAGGFVLDEHGVPFAYNQRESLLVQRFVAGVDASVNWLELLRD